MPSPYYTGAIQDSLSNWRKTFTLVTAPLCAAATLAFFAVSVGAGDGERVVEVDGANASVQQKEGYTAEHDVRAGLLDYPTKNSPGSRASLFIEGRD